MEKEKLEGLKKIEQTYGGFFRIGVAHLTDVGARHLTPIWVEKAKNDLQALPDEEAQFNIITKNAWFDIIDCAAELAHYSFEDIHEYINKTTRETVLDEEQLINKESLLRNMDKYIRQNIGNEDLICDIWLATGVPDDTKDDEYTELAEDKTMMIDSLLAFAKCVIYDNE